MTESRLPLSLYLLLSFESDFDLFFVKEVGGFSRGLTMEEAKRGLGVGGAKAWSRRRLCKAWSLYWWCGGVNMVWNSHMVFRV